MVLGVMGFGGRGSIRRDSQGQEQVGLGTPEGLGSRKRVSQGDTEEIRSKK